MAMGGCATLGELHKERQTWYSGEDESLGKRCSAFSCRRIPRLLRLVRKDGTEVSFLGQCLYPSLPPQKDLVVSTAGVMLWEDTMESVPTDNMPVMRKHKTGN